jgi:hypothetical protein
MLVVDDAMLLRVLAGLAPGELADAVGQGEAIPKSCATSR